MIEDKTHRYEFRVSVGLTDMSGVMYHARYLERADEARQAFLYELDSEYAEQLAQDGVGFSIPELNAKFETPAGYGSPIKVNTMIVDVGEKSLQVAQWFTSKDEVLAHLDITLVTVQNGKSIGIPQRLKELLLSVCDPKASGRPQPRIRQAKQQPT